LAPSSNNAVNWAFHGVALFGDLDNSTFLAFAFIGTRNGAVLCRLAAATALRARSGARPTREVAVHRAVRLRANADFVQGGAQSTTVVVAADHFACLSLRATTASGTAATERGPFTNNTIDGTLLLIADTLLLKQTTIRTTKSRRTLNASDVPLNASAAACSAGVPNTPVRKLAVYWAVWQVARHDLRQLGACFAAMSGTRGHLSGGEMLANATSHRASGPLTPFADFTVHGATLGVTVLGFVQSRASITTMLGMDGDGARTILGTTTALLVTLRPFGERRNVAVDRARAIAAHVAFSEGTTSGTTESGLLDNGTGTDAVASTTAGD